MWRIVQRNEQISTADEIRWRPRTEVQEKPGWRTNARETNGSISFQLTVATGLTRFVRIALNCACTIETKTVAEPLEGHAASTSA